MRPSHAPAAVKKRVYIIDEVHADQPAFNALLKILEEPPAPDVHSGHHRAPQGVAHHPVPVPAVFLQAHSAPGHHGRLNYVAEQEGIDFTEDGPPPVGPAGRRRHAGCPVPAGPVRRRGRHRGPARVLDTLGLAGSLKTAYIFNAIRRGDASGP